MTKDNKWIQQSRRIQDKHTQKFMFLYTRNKQSENEINKIIPFKITSKEQNAEE